MYRSLLRAVLVAAGLALVLLSLNAWPAPEPAHAQVEPPPRPTLTPAPPTPVPTRQPGRSQPTAVPAGRIAGTVIDQTTGAPAPSVAVTIGVQTVWTDANGNYDLPGLPAGSYTVVLALTAEQGTPAQEPVVVTLAADATVIQHLAFRSPAAAGPAPTAAAEPAKLPSTGGAGGAEWPAIALGLLCLGLGAGLRRQRDRAAR